MRIVAVFVFIFVVGTSARGLYADVRLNEVLADPSADWDGDGSVGARDDEWVEIVNTGSSVVDLSRYRLGDVSGGFTWRFAFAGTLSPGEFAVVYGSDALTWQSTSGSPSFGLSLNNGGDTVYLYDVSGGDTLVVDEYTYASHEAQDDRSTGRHPDGSGEWVLFDELKPYSGSTPPLGTGCSPSPGATNTCATLVPVEAATWGVVKTRFRR